MKSSAIFLTDRAVRYLSMICQHFDHKVEATCKPGKGHVRFSFGQCEMSADAHALAFVATAEDEANLDKVRRIVTSHLDRFAFRENPDLSWKEENS